MRLCRACWRAIDIVREPGESFEELGATQSLDRSGSVYTFRAWFAVALFSREVYNDPVFEARAFGPTAQAMTERLDSGRFRDRDIVENQRVGLRHARAICKSC